MKKYVIVGNYGSYYHEGYWTGRENKFSSDKSKALLMTSDEAKVESSYIEENVISPSSFILTMSKDSI